MLFELVFVVFILKYFLLKLFVLIYCVTLALSFLFIFYKASLKRCDDNLNNIVPPLIFLIFFFSSVGSISKNLKMLPK
jgi:hypothetical protein